MPKPSLLAPKLQLPRPRASLVARERLLARLDAGLERKLTLLCAPAGFGKTTLASQWADDRRRRGSVSSVAWLSLDTGDDDPVRFWRYVIAACQTFETDLDAALALLLAAHSPWSSSFAPPSLEPMLTVLLNALTHLDGSYVLVLEDYHAITATRIHEAMTTLIEHLPPALHLIMTTRSVPPLSLARLRARDDLVELHAEDLRFSLEETQRFLHQALPFPLSPEAIERLDARAEGWGAGLRLLALALHGRPVAAEAEQVLASVAGSQRQLLEYFIAEVLDAQPEPMQHFLLQTSVLDRLTAPLCNAVTGRTDSERILDALERAGLFLLPLDATGQWFRYHALFAEAMQHAGRRRLGDDALRACLSNAGAWYEQQGMLADAVDATLAAGDPPRAATLIGRLVTAWQLADMGHELHTLRRWLEQLPEAVLREQPELCLTYASVLLFAADRPAPAPYVRVDALLRLAEARWRLAGNTAGLGEALTLRALVAWRQGRFDVAIPAAGQALLWLPDAIIASRSICLGIVGGGDLQAGRVEAARQKCLEALALCEALDNRPGMRVNQIMLGDVCQARGELHQAAEIYRRVHAEAGDDLADKEKTLLGLAQLSYEWNDLVAVERHAREALGIRAQFADEIIQVQATCLLARVQHARGETDQAHALLQALQARLPVAHAPPIRRDLLLWQARFQLASADLEAAQRWVAAREESDPATPVRQREQEAMLLARLQIAQHDAETALSLLGEWLTSASAAGRTRSALEMQTLMALAHYALDQTTEAEQFMRQVLALARAEGYVRLFLDEGEAMASLLRGIAPQVRRRSLIAYLRAILHAFDVQRAARDGVPARDAAPLIEPLSPREQRVLRLLVAGRSNPEIAQELFVSINTVKTQVRSIYRKLDVDGRAAARATARRLQLA